MEIQNLLHADYLDILFDHRNKNYGGYELRKHYNERTTKAALVTLLATGLLCAYSYWHHDSSTSAFIIHKIPYTLTDLSKRVISEAPLPKLLPIKRTPATAHKDVLVRPVITTANVKPNELLKPNEITSISTPSTRTGNSTATVGVTGIDPIGADAAPRAKPVTWVEQMPEFVGDFNNYIVSHMRYPEAARSANITGRVIVRFVVNEDGTISDAKVMQGIGGGCDEEAIRVINSMPEWKPGKQNGVAVKVYCSVPINFMLQ